MEGSTEYTQLLYIPSQAPFDLWNREKAAGVKLYVKRVFIMDEAEALLPTYLRFVKGVIDSADLPLNVSRELLQESRDVKAIREGSTKRVLGMLEDLAKQEKDESATRRGQGQVRASSTPSSAPCSRKAWARTSPTASASPSCCALPRPPSDTVERLAGRLQGAHEGRPGGHLLHHGRHAGRREEQPAARDLPQEGHRGAADDRPRRRVGAELPARVRRHAAADRWPRARSTWASCRTRPRRRRPRKRPRPSSRCWRSCKEALKDKAEDVRVTTRLVDSPACLVVQRRRHEHAARAHAQAGRPEGARRPSRCWKSTPSTRW